MDLGFGPGLDQTLLCIDPAAGGFLRIWILKPSAARTHVMAQLPCLQGPPSFPPFGSFPFLLTLFLHLSFPQSAFQPLPFAFQWENRGDAAGSFACSQPHVPRCWPRAGRQLPATTAERRAQNPPLNHIIQLICIAIHCHKFSAHLIYWLYQEYHERNNCTKTIEYQSVNQKQEFSLQLETKQCYNLPCKEGHAFRSKARREPFYF